MGLRIRKSIQICKGVRLNFGTSGASISFGTKGLRHTIHTNGRRTTSVGIPGTGISYVKTHSAGKKASPARGNKARQAPRSQHARQIPLPGQNRQADYQGQGNDTIQFQEYNNLINTLKGIHQTCDEPIDWNTLKTSAAPFQPGTMGPRQAAAIKALQDYQPDLFVRASSDNKRRELEKAVEQAAAEDAEDYENWSQLVSLAERVLGGDLDAYLDVIDQMDPLADLIDFGTDFEFGADNAGAIEVEFKIKADSVVPQYVLSLTDSGRLQRKEMSKTAYYELVQDFVCSCSFRITRDILALLPVKTVAVHAVEDGINTQTGQREEMTVLSVLFDRDIFDKLNFEYIDPSDALNNFLYNMKFQKTTGFKPVSRVENY